jgi:hypothetical protein
MQLVLIAAISLHLLAGTFWAGTSFTLARAGGAGAAALFRPQMGAAMVAVLAGAYLWSQLHAGAFGRSEQLLATGATAALIAAGVQGALCGPAIRRLGSGSEDGRSRARIALAQRLGAGLLAFAIICMAAARFA